MKKKIVSILLLCSIMLAGCGGTTSVGNEITPKDAKTEHLKDASLEDLRKARKYCYDILRTQTDLENPMMSPISAYIAVSMVAEGAKGDTKAQFEDVLGTGYRKIAAELMHEYQMDGESLELMLSNGIWLDDDFVAADEWLNVVSGYYTSAVYQRNLSDAAIVNEVNDWVKAKTKNKIDSMLDEPLGDLARLALFNAVYFNGKWERPFEANDTYFETFTKEDGSTVDVEMMHQYGERYQYLSNDYAEGVVLPYKEDKFAYVALKPAAGQTVRELFGQLTEDEMSELIANAESTKVNLMLPKYEVEYDETLNDAFAALGVTDVFSELNSDLTGLGTSKDGLNLYISLIRQRAVFTLDEEGTEAAAVTGIVVEAAGAIMDVEQPKELYFDEPFVYMIMDMETELPLFMGIMDNPVTE